MNTNEIAAIVASEVGWPLSLGKRYCAALAAEMSSELLDGHCLRVESIGRLKANLLPPHRTKNHKSQRRSALPERRSVLATPDDGPNGADTLSIEYLNRRIDIAKKMAEALAAAYVSAIRLGLRCDGRVNIKGIGTFSASEDASGDLSFRMAKGLRVRFATEANASAKTMTPAPLAPANEDLPQPLEQAPTSAAMHSRGEASNQDVECKQEAAPPIENSVPMEELSEQPLAKVEKTRNYSKLSFVGAAAVFLMLGALFHGQSQKSGTAMAAEIRGAKNVDASPTPSRIPTPTVDPVGTVSPKRPLEAPASSSFQVPILEGDNGDAEDTHAVTIADASEHLQASPRRHLARAGDTLAALATEYYDTADAWPLIFSANAKAIGHPDNLDVGQDLVIPQLNSDFTSPAKDERGMVVTALQTAAKACEATYPGLARLYRHRARRLLVHDMR